MRTVFEAAGGHDYFAWATTSMARYHESAEDDSDGLPVPHWGCGRLHAIAGSAG